MARRPRRNHSAAFKAKVAVAAIKGDKTLVEVAERFDVHPNQITQWKSQLLERTAGIFETAGHEKTSLAGGVGAGSLRHFDSRRVPIGHSVYHRRHAVPA
jgi:transposase-like protein